MSVLTIRVAEDKHARLRILAKQRGISLNRLMDELATIALVQHDTEARFRILVRKGSKAKGLAVLDKLDRAFAKAR
ncbi:MAG: toxin-antitoxin system HicB family antitoxin [Acidobacteriota bacterium]